MRLLKRLLATIGVLILVIAVVSLWFLNRGGAFRTIEPHFAGTCEALPLDGSAEDILVDRGRGIAYLSLMDRQALVKGGAAQGTVARVDLNVRPFTSATALATKPDHFRPHGMSLHIDENGQRRLFVINHPVNRGTEAEMVELFTETGPGEFTHSETLGDPLMISPNDLVAVGPRQFYVANDKALGGGFAAGLQQAGIGASPLNYFDGSAMRNVSEDIASGGGINVSADLKTLYVAETSGKRLRVLDRASDGSVTERARIAVDTAPDNIDVAEDGSLWVTGHANTLALIRHFIGGSPAPTQVWRIELAAGGAKAPEEIFLDDGTRMSAGSVGATWNQLLLIGSITEKKIMICERSVGT
jgi:arylesterase/paraoxonase